MSTNIAPSLRVTNRRGSGPSTVGVAQARFEEAKAITDALVVRLSRERGELRGAVDEVRVRVFRRIEITRIELADARAYEARAFRLWEEERKAVAGKDVAGSRCSRDHQHGFSPVSPISGPSASRLRPVAAGASPRGRKIV